MLHNWTIPHAFDKVCTNIYEMVPYTKQAHASLKEYSQDASQLLDNPKSVFDDIPMASTKYTVSLFEETNDPEIDALTTFGFAADP